MRRVTLTLVTVSLLLPMTYGLSALDHGWQPIAVGTIPMTDPVLATGDWEDYHERAYGPDAVVFH